MPHGITQCYLPLGRGDIPALTPAEAGTRLSDPGGMQGWVDVGGWTTCPKLLPGSGTTGSRLQFFWAKQQILNCADEEVYRLHAGRAANALRLRMPLWLHSVMSQRWQPSLSAWMDVWLSPLRHWRRQCHQEQTDRQRKGEMYNCPFSHWSVYIHVRVYYSVCFPFVSIANVASKI